MHTLSRKKKLLAALVGAAVVLTGGGIALAYWTSSGATGTGTATTGTQANTLTITQTNTPAGLAPGLAPTGVTGTVANSAAGKATFVSQVVVTVGSVTPASGLTCTIGNYGLVAGTSTTVLTSSAGTISTATPTLTLTINQEVNPGATINLPAFSIGFVDYTTLNQNGCQAATPNLTYTLS
jgi:hypothetical protein